MNDDQFEVLMKRLGTIEKLLASSILKEKTNQKEKITTLSSFGFTPSQIAEMLDTTSNTVQVVLSRERKKKGKRQQK